MGSERIGVFSVSYFDNVIIGRLFPERHPTEIGTNDFLISSDEPAVAFASACCVVVVQGTNMCGIYHGSINRRDDEINVYGKTLEEFLNAWTQAGVNARAAFIFGASSGLLDDPEMLQFREDVRRMVIVGTGVNETSLVIKWNNYEEGETDVVVDPSTGTINVNIRHWD